eukprot:2755421-Amphidinium_carterae.3
MRTCPLQYWMPTALLLKLQLLDTNLNFAQDLLSLILENMPVIAAVARALKAVNGMQICALEQHEFLDRTPKLYEVEDLPLKPVHDQFTGSLKIVMMVERIDAPVDLQAMKQHVSENTLHHLGLPVGFASKLPDCTIQFACVADAS